jgi:hypothetical protein
MAEHADGHIAVKHTNCEATNCMFCEGGLFACTVCGSFEGATTTDCPGWDFRGVTVRSTKAASGIEETLDDLVYAGQLDYRWDEGWVQAASRWSPGYWRTAS